MSRAIVWRRLDTAGLEFAYLEDDNPNWHLHGTVIIADAGRPTRLDYAVVCDSAWRTLWARVSGSVGLTPVNHRIARSPAGRWRFDGIEQPGLDGCVDVDLAFTPFTNTIVIRRTTLPVGGSCRIRAAWLRFPDFDLVPSEQVYTREEDRRYRYESGDGAFTAKLDLDDAGMVLRYGNIWLAEATLPAEK